MIEEKEKLNKGVRWNIKLEKSLRKWSKREKKREK